MATKTKKAEKRVYRFNVDAEMLGDLGSSDVNERISVSDFCDLLTEIGSTHGMEIDANPITDSYNGATNDEDADEDMRDIDSIWDEALIRYAERLENEIAEEREAARPKTTSFRLPQTTRDAIKAHAARMSPARPVSATDALIDLVRVGAAAATPRVEDVGVSYAVQVGAGGELAGTGTMSRERAEEFLAAIQRDGWVVENGGLRRADAARTIHRVGANGREHASSEEVVCEDCGKRGLRGDFPQEGGIVADGRGRLICDSCADANEIAKAAADVPPPRGFIADVPGGYVVAIIRTDNLLDMRGTKHSTKAKARAQAKDDGIDLVADPR